MADHRLSGRDVLCLLHDHELGISGCERSYSVSCALRNLRTTHTLRITINIAVARCERRL
eukprot:5624587-Pleurochrysis_carterae.AAC.6